MSHKINHTFLIFVFITLICIDLIHANTSNPFIIPAQLKKESLDKYISYIEDPHHQISLIEAQNSVWRAPARTPFNTGFTGADYYFQLIISNKNNESNRFLIELANPSINHIQLFAINDNGTIDTLTIMGDRYAHSTRKIDATTFYYDLSLPQGQSKKLFFHLSNDNRQLHVPFVIWDYKYYQDYARSKAYWWGALIGFVILFLGTTLIVTLFARSSILLYYLFYTISFSMYLLALKGLGFQLLWPEQTTFQSYAMELFKYATGFFFIPFVMKFFNTSVRFPTWHQILKYMLWAFIVVTVFRFLYVYTKLISPFIIMIVTQITSIGLIIGDAVIWWVAYTSYRQTKKWEDIWVLAVCSMFLINLTLMVALHLGWIPGWNWVENFLIVGFLVEIIVLSAVLTYRYYALYKSNYQLAVDLSKAKEASIQNFLNGQNEERKRLSEQLHDSISLSLANIKMRLSHARSVITQSEVKDIITPLIEDLGSASKEVRNMSHSLSPLVLKRGTIESALEDLAQRTKWAYPDVQVHWNPIDNETGDLKLSESMSQHIYYIASELINNATKHAKASEIHIDFIKDNHAVELKIKDNGIGYDIQQAFKGIGLEHIKQRVSLLNGLFEINKLDKGMMHVVKLVY